MAQITELLNAAQAGDASAGEAAYASIYDELKRCARRQRGVGPGASLSATALVSELYLRLSQSRLGAIRDRGHFFALAARAMRQIIIDHARRKQSAKRGGAAPHDDIDAAFDVSEETAQQALELDAALTGLAEHDADLARVVEWHFFAGLSFKEIGAELDRHERTVRHDWELARAVLQRMMGRELPP